MPKDRSTRAVSFERRRSRVSPYPSRGKSVSGWSEESVAGAAYQSNGKTVSCQPEESGAGAAHRSHGKGVLHRSEESVAAAAAAAAAAAKQAAEWEHVRCPVCMDHPHNAVLLMCSSHEKGCRPFICDTSYRHSNCLDQYRKASKDSSKDSGAVTTPECSECQQAVKLMCPLCRGPVSHWTKDYDARRYLNSKVRACTTESCEFKGAYNKLRRHAREDHPTMRPTVVDPERQRDWQRLEQQRDLGDLFSMLRSGLTGREEGVGVSEGEEDISERTLHSPSITMVLIVRTGRSILHYRDGPPGRRRRTLYIIGENMGSESSPAGGANGSGGAEATAPDNEEGEDDMAVSTEALAGSQPDAGDVDGDSAH